MFETPFDSILPPGMDTVLGMAVLYREGTPTCPRCGSTRLRKLDQGTAECMECGAELKIRLGPEEISNAFDLLKDRDENIRLGASIMLLNVSRDDLTDMIEHLDEIVRALKTEQTKVQANMAGLLGRIAENHAGKVKKAVPHLLPLLERDIIRGNAAAALLYISQEYPDRVIQSLDRIVHEIEEHPDNHNLMGLLASLARTHPERIKEHSSLIISALNSRTDPTVYNALNAVAQLTRRYPEIAVDNRQRLRGMLSSQDRNVRHTASAVFSILAKQRPEAIDQATEEKLRELTEDPHGPVRENAEEALEYR